MERSIIINIPKENEVKISALTSRVKQQNLPVIKSTLSVNSVLRKNSPAGTLSEQLKEVVSREFEKIRATI